MLELTDFIECADFINYLPKIQKGLVDLILTDPPYSISRDTGFKSVVKGVKRFAVSMDFGEWDHFQVNLSTLASELYRILRDGGTTIIFYDLWKITHLVDAMTNVGFKQIRLIIWEKTNPVPLNSKRNYLTNSREIAVLGVKRGKPTFNSEYDKGVYHLPIPREKRFHPTQKPIRLIKKLIQKHSNENDIVLDCFLGSGTTIVAAKELNRRYLGCEIDSGYFKKAKLRIAGGLLDV